MTAETLLVAAVPAAFVVGLMVGLLLAAAYEDRRDRERWDDAWEAFMGRVRVEVDRLERERGTA